MIRTFGWNEIWLLLLAFRWTIALSAAAFVGGGILGAAVAVLRISPSPVVRRVVAAYIKLLQGMPLLVLLFLIYFGPTIFGVRSNAWAAAFASLSIYASAFLGEIWRGCLQAVPEGQWQAARALGLDFGRALRLVIAPQAARIAVPPTLGFLVQLIKATSLASLIGFVEVTRAGQMVNSATFQPLLVFTIVGVLYFALCAPLSVLAAHLEKRLSYSA
jgi:polar amino acid transport system permease protein